MMVDSIAYCRVTNKTVKECICFFIILKKDNKEISQVNLQQYIIHQDIIMFKTEQNHKRQSKYL